MYDFIIKKDFSHLFLGDIIWFTEIEDGKIKEIHWYKIIKEPEIINQLGQDIQYEIIDLKTGKSSSFYISGLFSRTDIAPYQDGVYYCNYEVILRDLEKYLEYKKRSRSNILYVLGEHQKILYGVY